MQFYLENDIKPRNLEIEIPHYASHSLLLLVLASSYLVIMKLALSKGTVCEALQRPTVDEK